MFCSAQMTWMFCKCSLLFEKCNQKPKATEKKQQVGVGLYVVCKLWVNPCSYPTQWNLDFVRFRNACKMYLTKHDTKVIFHWDKKDLDS